ncbi:MAG: MalY/PatB family protein, partial [Fusobacteriaceae bacterium]
MKTKIKFKTNFSDYTERKNSDSRKWSVQGMHEMATYVDDESIPLWVADMDYKVLPLITEKLKERVEHSVFGYNLPSNMYYDSIKYWNKSRNSWEIEREWILSIPGIVVGLNFAINAFTKIGDGVIVQNPVYPPFKTSISNNNRTIVDNTLIDKNGEYIIDFKDLEEKMSNPKNKLMIICNPHNPIGKVWRKEDLEKIGEMCLKNNVVLVSDEIHSDLILFGNKFTTIGVLDEKIV